MNASSQRYSDVSIYSPSIGLPKCFRIEEIRREKNGIGPCCRWHGAPGRFKVEDRKKMERLLLSGDACEDYAAFHLSRKVGSQSRKSRFFDLLCSSCQV